MKRAWFIIIGGLLLGIVAYACTYFTCLCCTAKQHSTSQSDQPPMSWMQREYHLNDAQYARVRELHEAYQPRCMEMCRKIDEQNTQLQKLLTATNVITPEIKQALAEAAQLRTDCQTAMFEHFYEVAGVMPEEEGKRYLAWVQQETLMPGQMPPTQPASSSAPQTP